MKRPFQSCERRSWLTCDVTCFEVWHQPSHNVKQTVVPNSLMLTLVFFFNNCLLLIIKEKNLFIRIGLYYWTQSSTFRSKDWIFLVEVLFEVMCVDHWHTFFFGVQKFLQWIFCWANTNLTCSEIFLIQKQQACFEELFFRVLELQKFFMSKILAMKIFLSKHKSSQMLKAAIQPTVFLWILYPLGILHLRTG